MNVNFQTRGQKVTMEIERIEILHGLQKLASSMQH